MGWGAIKFTISRLLTLQMLHIKFSQDWLSGSCQLYEKILMDDIRRLMPTHSNKSFEWLRWPKNCTFLQLSFSFVILIHIFLRSSFLICNITLQFCMIFDETSGYKWVSMKFKEFFFIPASTFQGILNKLYARMW